MSKIIRLLLATVSIAVAFLFPIAIMFSGISPASKGLVLFFWTFGAIPIFLDTAIEKIKFGNQM